MIFLFLSSGHEVRLINDLFLCQHYNHLVGSAVVIQVFVFWWVRSQEDDII
jgi:hypothetical protein